MLLQKRSNGIYYFRWVYPSLLRKLFDKRELIKSLHTSSKTKALIKASAYYMIVDQLNSVADKYKQGLISYEECENQTYEIFMSNYFDSILKGLNRYIPADLATVEK